MSKDLPIDEFYLEPLASTLDLNRAKKRLGGKRLVYDCFKAAVVDIDLVECAKGYKFHVGNRKDGKASLRTILRGNITVNACQECEFYDNEEEYPPEYIHSLPVQEAKKILTIWLKGRNYETH